MKNIKKTIAWAILILLIVAGLSVLVTIGGLRLMLEVLGALSLASTLAWCASVLTKH